MYDFVLQRSINRIQDQLIDIKGWASMCIQRQGVVCASKATKYFDAPVERMPFKLRSGSIGRLASSRQFSAPSQADSLR